MNAKSMSRIAVLAGVMAVCPLFTGLAAAHPTPEHVSMTGWISCTTCLLPNKCHAQNRFGCTQWWVSQGASYVLMVGDKHYVLTGSEKDLAKAAGENSVTVTGDLDGNLLSVASVERAPKKHAER